MKTNLIRFPVDRTKQAKLERAIDHAEKVLRLARLSDRRLHPEFRRDQENFTDHMHRLRLPLPNRC